MGVVQDTLDTMVDGVNATTELIRKKHNENVGFCLFVKNAIIYSKYRLINFSLVVN